MFTWHKMFFSEFIFNSDVVIEDFFQTLTKLQINMPLLPWLFFSIFCLLPKCTNFRVMEGPLGQENIDFLNKITRKVIILKAVHSLKNGKKYWDQIVLFSSHTKFLLPNVIFTQIYPDRLRIQILRIYFSSVSVLVLVQF